MYKKKFINTLRVCLAKVIVVGTDAGAGDGAGAFQQSCVTNC